MSDVLINYSVLNQLNGSLKQILVEFDQASKRENALESAIGKPDGRTKLKDLADEFESGWDDRRTALQKDIAEVQQHVDQVGKGWEQWDTEASKKLKVDADAAEKLPKKN